VGVVAWRQSDERAMPARQVACIVGGLEHLVEGLGAEGLGAASCVRSLSPALKPTRAGGGGLFA
jgi:hypothetical protein